MVARRTVYLVSIRAYLGAVAFNNKNNNYMNNNSYISVD